MKRRGNKKMPIPRHEIIDNPIPTSLFFNNITCIIIIHIYKCSDFSSNSTPVLTSVIYAQKERVWGRDYPSTYTEQLHSTQTMM